MSPSNSSSCFLRRLLAVIAHALATTPPRPGHPANVHYYSGARTEDESAGRPTAEVPRRDSDCA